MRDLAVAFALILVIEGGLYALFPGGMKRMVAEVLRLPEPTIRNFGLIAAALGVGILIILNRAAD